MTCLIECAVCDGEGWRYIHTGGSGTCRKLVLCDECGGEGEYAVDEHGEPIRRDRDDEVCDGY